MTWKERQSRQIRVAIRFARMFGLSPDEALVMIMDRFRVRYPHV